MHKLSEKPQSKLTKSEWIQLCLEWERSGERQKLFCGKRKIHYPTFVYWRMRFKKETCQKSPASFSTVNIKPAAISSFRIHLLNGMSLSIPSTMDKTDLKSLFDLLGITAC